MNAVILTQRMIVIAVLLFQNCYAIKIDLVHSSKLRDGIVHTTYSSPDFPLVAHVITLPLQSAHIQLCLADGQREEVSSIAKRAGAFIAVNGCNYRRGGRFNGNRLNLLCHNRKIYADLGLPRGSLGWNNQTKAALVAPVALETTLKINGKPLPVDGINQPRGVGQSILYTDVADLTLLKYRLGNCIVVNDGMVVEEVISAHDPHGWCMHDDVVLSDVDFSSNMIPYGWHIYQTDADLSIQKGDVVQLEFALVSAGEQIADPYDFVMGGAGLLVHNGAIVTAALYDEFSQGSAVVHCHDEVAADFSTKQMQEWLIELRHPRTAVGITNNNELCLVVVDGRQTTSEGLSLHELAQFMESLGCVHALNIGGGGCSTLYIDSAVVNTPSANEERPVSEALCIF